MFSRMFLAALTAVLSAACLTVADELTEYPVSPRVPVVETLHGVEVEDPYRWLEELDSEKTLEWIEAQSRVTLSKLETIPQREQIRERLTELWDFERYGVPEKYGNRYFFRHNDGLQNQDVIYTAESLDEKPRVLLDPNTLSPDGTIALTNFEVSPDGSLLAYGLSHGGSDWQEWKVRDVESGEDLKDHLKWIKFSTVSWSRDGRGFYYSRYDEPSEGEELAGINYHHKLYYHRLGTLQEEDVLVYERPDQKEWGFSGEVTEDGNYLIIHVWQGTDRRNRVFYKDLRRSEAGVVELLADFDASYTFIANDGPVFWFLTDLEAPRSRVVAIDVRTPERGRWREVIPQSEDTLRAVEVAHDRFVASYLRAAHTALRVFELDGTPRGEVDLPGLGTVSSLRGRRDDPEAFFSFTSFTTPPTVFRYEMQEERVEEFRRPEVPFDPEDFEVRQVFYTSRDGTRVPMFISHRKGVELNGTSPTHLYGYGGFNIPITPSFSAANMVWMERGGVFAVANIRGGGEYGESWHLTGTRLNKQNVFDDFIAAAEWLIENGYTSPARLGITGGSNGGLLVAACMIQRPDLFGAVVPRVGVLDMLRFHKFTIGWAWVSDYGSPDDPEEFRALYAYSPYHNLREGTHYPATLITTADHDDRVVPIHSFKFAAALQHAQGGPAPTLIRIEARAGHGAGTATAKRIEEWTDILAFMEHNLKG